MINNILKIRREGNVIFVSFPSKPVEAEQIETIHYEFVDLRELLSSEEDVRACVITGLSTLTFKWVTESCNGMDRWATCMENVPSLSSVAQAIKIPLIIGMDGDFAGPGLELALFCDIRLATPDTSFRFPHTKMGWIPFNGATQILPRLIGRSRALEMLLSGSVMEAEAAYENGLIHYIVNGNELKATMAKMAAKMAVNSPISLKFTKETVTKGLDMTIDQGLRLEADLYFLMHSADDRTEGINAFKEKRKPFFKGQ